jgi:hypothetical protein
MTDEEIVEAIRAHPGAVVLPPPASPDAVAEAEEAIGYRLPHLLRRFYLEVANGGFGPRGDALGVPGGPSTGEWTDIVDVHRAFSSGPEPNAPAWLIWLLDWGCATWSLVDCRDPAGPMWGWDPNGCCQEHALSPQQKLSRTGSASHSTARFRSRIGARTPTRSPTKEKSGSPCRPSRPDDTAVLMGRPRRRCRQGCRQKRPGFDGSGASWLFRGGGQGRGRTADLPLFRPTVSTTSRAGPPGPGRRVPSRPPPRGRPRRGTPGRCVRPGLRWPRA